MGGVSMTVPPRADLGNTEEPLAQDSGGPLRIIRTLLAVKESLRNQPSEKSYSKCPGPCHQAKNRVSHPEGEPAY